MKREIYDGLNSQADELVELVNQIKTQQNNVENFKELLKDPNFSKMDYLLDKTLPQLENASSYSLPEEVIQFMEDQQKYTHQIKKVYSALVDTQDKVIRLQAEAIKLQGDISNRIIKSLTGKD